PPRRPDARGPLPVSAARALARRDPPGALVKGDAVKRILAALAIFAAACGHSSPPGNEQPDAGNQPDAGVTPAPQQRIALPSGAALKPYDPTKPGEARPLYTAQLGGHVYAALTNARAEGFSVLSAGPG